MTEQNPIDGTLVIGTHYWRGDDVPATTVSLVFGATVVFSSLTPGLAGVLADVTGDVAATFFMSAAISFATAGYAAVRSLSK